MKLTVTLSSHAVEKHLDHNNITSSVFFDREIMYDSINQCVKKPDFIQQYGKRFHLTKTFGYDIGILLRLIN